LFITIHFSHQLAKIIHSAALFHFQNLFPISFLFVKSDVYLPFSRWSDALFQFLLF